MPIAFTGSFTTGSVSSTAGTSFSFTSTTNAPTGSVAFVGVAVDNLNCLAGVWSSRSSMITARRDLAGAGTQNAALGFGGSASPPVVVACTEAYNGTSWSIGGALINSRRGLAGAGASNTAALAFGAPTCTEAYNGTTWSSGGAMINGRSFLAGTGTQNAALGMGAGFTEAYNGTIWSTGGAMITSRSCLGGAGTQNSALAFGGGTNVTACNTTEAYNGTSWSSGGALINPRVGNVGSGASNSAVITYGGARPGVGQITTSENYNGTSWSNGSALSLGRYFLGNAGNTNTSALAFGGRDSFGGVQTACTEAYNVNTFYTSSLVTRITDNNYNTNTFSYALQGTGSGFNSTVRTVISDGSGSFYVGGDFTTYNGASAPYLVRLNSAGIVSQSFGLDGPVYKVLIQNGVAGTTSVASWTTQAAMINSAVRGGLGTQNAALAYGRFAPSIGVDGVTEQYNGVAWAAGGSGPGMRQSGGTGIQNAAITIGSGNVSPSTPVNSVQTYNGTSWTGVTALITGRSLTGASGTQNSALTFGGSSGGTTYSCTEAYNGTSWSACAAMITARQRLAGAGTQNTALAFGGNPTYTFAAVGTTCVESYNGITWAVGGAMTIAGCGFGRAGGQVDALAFGRCAPLGTGVNTEAYNGTAWSARNSMNVNRGYIAGAGTQAAALGFAGYSTPSGPTFSCTEAFTCVNAGTFNTGSKLVAVGDFTNFSGIPAIRAIRFNINNASPDFSFATSSSFNNTVCTLLEQSSSVYTCVFPNWTTISPLIVGRQGLAGAGTQAVALAFGGSQTAPTVVTCTEGYNNITWIAGGAMITARQLLGGVGTSTAALAFAGSGSTILTCTEKYNGTSWSSGNAMINALLGLAGAGTQNAALAFGGSGSAAVTCTETYSGITWTAGGALINARMSLAGAGATNTAALAFAGSGSTLLACTEAYDGLAWSAGGAMITARCRLAGAGTQNAALASGGATTVSVACTETYNGTAWSTAGAMITTRQNLAGAGLQTAGLAFGGVAPGASCTEAFNLNVTYNSKLLFGGAFTQYSGSTSSGSVRVNNNGTLDSTFNIGAGFSPVDVRTIALSGSVILFGGNFTSYSGSSVNRVVATNSSDGTVSSSFSIGTGFNGAVNSIAVQSDGGILTTGEFTQYSGSNINRLARLTPSGSLDTAFSSSIGSGLNNTGSVVYIYPTGSVASWSTVGAMITARTQLAGVGRQNLAVAFGGATPTVVACTEIFNGGSWVAGPALILNRCSLAGIGTDFAALAFGGANNSIQNVTEAYNGTSCVWVLGSNLITRRQDLAGAGTQNAALGFGGATPTIVACTEIYNGISWRAGSAMITARCTLAGAGIQNAALAFGGRAASPIGFNACTEAYNGTSWSTGGAMINARTALAGAGIQNAALAFGGTPVGACTETYNGTSWSTGGAMITARSGLGGGGTQNASIAFGGATPTAVACTETYNTPQILVGGSFTSFSGSNYSGSVRLFLSGTLDTTYTVGTGFSGSTQVLDYLAISSSQGGSRVIAVGGFTGYGGATQNCVQTATINPQPNQNRIILLNPDGTMAGTYLAGTGSVYTKIAEAVQISGSNEGIAVALFKSEVTGALGSIPPGTIGTVTLVGSITNKAAGGIVMGNFPTSSLTSSLALSGSASTSQNPPPMAAPSGSFGENLIVRVIAHEGPVSDTFRPTAGFSNFISNYDTWGTRAAMITARSALAGAGTQIATLAFGGNAAAPIGLNRCTEAYNNITWTAGGAMITARSGLGGAGAINTAAIAFGGSAPLAATCTEIYNGTSWAVGGAMIAARTCLGGTGTSTATLAFGGGCPTATCTERYNGASWAVVSAMNVGKAGPGGAGVQNAALAFGGSGAAPLGIATEAYNGTAWSTGGSMLNARFALGGAGTQAAALAFGGSPATTSTEAYNGTLWSTQKAMITGRVCSGNSGTQAAALAFGGVAPALTNATEGYISTNRIGTYLNCTNAFSELSLAGEFIVANNNLTSAPLYLSGSNSNILFGCTYAETIFGGKTFYIIVD